MTEAERGSLLRARSMVAPIREVLWIFPERRSRAFIKHTLLYYINDIDSEKHNQPGPSSPAAIDPTPVRPLWPRVRRTCALFRERARIRAASALRAFIRQQKRTISY